jgi:hypothetical protein
MDRVRFGRALGYGARHAAKTLMQAADAASTPSTARTEAGAGATQTGSAQRSAGNPAASSQPQRVASTAKHASRRLGRSMWSPLAKFSSVVWLQVTGLFFALLAMFLGQGAWKERAAMRLPPGSHEALRFYVMAAAFLAFAYFAVSNFVRAARRERR